MPADPNRPKVTLEELFRVKRAERPSPEFWSRFESELRAKQLAAIVEKRPWWRAMANPLVAWRMPIGAAAALALASVVAVREFSASSTSGSNVPVAQVAMHQATPTLPAPAANVSVPDVQPSVVVVAEAVSEAAPTTATSVASASTDQTTDSANRPLAVSGEFFLAREESQMMTPLTGSSISASGTIGDLTPSLITQASLTEVQTPREQLFTALLSVSSTIATRADAAYAKRVTPNIPDKKLNELGTIIGPKSKFRAL